MTETTPLITANQVPMPEASLVTRAAWQEEIAHRNGIGHVAMSNLLPPLDVRTLDNEIEAVDSLNRAAAIAEGNMPSLDFRMHLLDRVSDFYVAHPEFDRYDPAVEQMASRYALTDPRVREYMERHQTNYLAPYHNKLVEAWPAFSEKYPAGVRAGIEQGYIPAEAKARIEDAIELTGVRIVDLSIKEGYDPRANVEAEYGHIHDEVKLDYRPLSEGWPLEETLAHEFTHKISGGTFLAARAGNNGHYRNRIAFSTERNGVGFHMLGLTEPVTEHATQGILTGDFETFDPDKRENDKGTYYGPRKVMAKYIEESAGLVTPRMFVRALFEDTGPDGGLSERRNLARASLSAYGPGALTKLNVLCIAANISTFNDAEIAKLMDRIHPPEVAKDGTVLSRGWIDTSGIRLAD